MGQTTVEEGGATHAGLQDKHNCHAVCGESDRIRLLNKV